MSMTADASFVREARLAGEAAFRILHPPEPFAAGEPVSVALELYRQAIHWALAAHAQIRDTASSHTAEQAKEGAKAESTTSLEWVLPPLAELLATTSESALRSWARDDTHRDTCVHHLRAYDYTSFAKLSASEQHQVCLDLQVFYQRLLASLCPLALAAERAVLRRNLRLVGLTAMAVLLAFATWGGFRWYKLRSDLALNATWTSSSVYNPALECRSPDQVCEQGKDFFFCTRQENNPWFILDLEKNKKFSSLEIVNRKDCCRDRANPLHVSVSTDGKNWQLVAESTTEFSTFRPRFPEVSARYIKLEIPKPAAILHLTRVRVFP